MSTVIQNTSSGRAVLTGAAAAQAAAAGHRAPAWSLAEQVAALRAAGSSKPAPGRSRPRPRAYAPCGTPLRVLERAPAVLAALPPATAPAADGLTAAELMRATGLLSSGLYEVLAYLMKQHPCPLLRGLSRRPGRITVTTTYRRAQAAPPVSSAPPLILIGQHAHYTQE